MSRFLSILTLNAAPESRDEAIDVFIASGVIERCRESIPGFVSGMLLKSMHDAGAACVLVEWKNRQAYDDWMSSPLRGSHEKRLFEPPPLSHLYELVHEVQR